MSALDLVALEKAKHDAALAKARAFSTAEALKERLSPSNLVGSVKRTAFDKAQDAGTRAADAVARRPVTSSIAAGLVALLLFRKPLGRFRRFATGGKARQARKQREELIRAGATER